MAKHKIVFSQTTRDVMHSDLRFVVHSDGERLGELQISKGSIDWKPKNKQRSITWSWEKFARKMEGIE